LRFRRRLDIDRIKRLPSDFFYYPDYVYADAYNDYEKLNGYEKLSGS